MENKDFISEEMVQISAEISAIGNANVYAVPVNYFDELVFNILKKINAGNGSLIINKAPFVVPERFFDGFAESILSKIKLLESNPSNEIFEELEEIAPSLNKISKKNIYSVPDYYFEKFTPYNLSNAEPAKVIYLKNSSRKWFNYAVAAMLTGIIATGSFLFLNRDSQTQNTSLSQTAYSQFAKMNVSDNISKLSDAELTSYLNQFSDGDIFSSPSSNNDSGSVQDDINNSSDDEIQQYLQENKTPADKTIKGI